MAKDDLWCTEFNDCINEVLKNGAEKYEPRDWEKPEGNSMEHPKNCDSMFHHLAREFVYRENKELIDDLIDAFDVDCSCEPEYHHQEIRQLLLNLKYDESCARHTQHIATRAVMSYTREKRGLKE